MHSSDEHQSPFLQWMFPVFVDVSGRGPDNCPVPDLASNPLSNAIEAVAAVFPGPLGYAANWDEYTGVGLTEAIWENPHIDFIGVDLYPPLATDAQADASGDYPDAAFIDAVHANWERALQDLQDFAAARKNGRGMPVVLAEVGVTPTTALRQSRTATNSSRRTPRSRPTCSTGCCEPRTRPATGCPSSTSGTGPWTGRQAANVLTLINEINANGSRRLSLPPVSRQSPPPYWDVNGDNWLTPLDVLAVINEINARFAPDGEADPADAFWSQFGSSNMP